MLEVLDIVSFELVAMEGLDNPGAQAPPGLGDVATLILSYTKWIAGTLGVIGVIVIAIMMMIGRRNRSQMAADGLSALPWIVGGFLLIGLASTLGDWLISTGEAVDESEFVLEEEE